MAGSISSRMCLLYMGISPIWFLLIVENSNLTQIVILGKGSLQITVWQLGSVSLQKPFRRILTNNANKGGDPRGWDWMSAPSLELSPHSLLDSQAMCFSGSSLLASHLLVSWPSPLPLRILYVCHCHFLSASLLLPFFLF